jgi:hypothetical protein
MCYNVYGYTIRTYSELWTKVDRVNRYDQHYPMCELYRPLYICTDIITPHGSIYSPLGPGHNGLRYRCLYTTTLDYLRYVSW